MGTRLYRSRDDRVLAGVAGGLAELWDADPSVIRIIWALLVVLTGGIALLVYIVMAIVVPEEPWPGAITGMAPPPPGAMPGWTPPGTTAAGAADPGAAAQPSAFTTPTDWRTQRAVERAQRRAERRAYRGQHGSDGRTASIVIGAILVLVGIAFLFREYLPNFDFDYVWPLILVALGVLVLVTAIRPSGPTGGSSNDPSGGSPGSVS